PLEAGKIKAVGSARVDLLRQAAAPKPLGERYVVVNTSFGITNNILGDLNKALENWIGSAGLAPGPETEAMLRDRVSFEQAALGETFSIIDWLVSNTPFRIVIRPHPVERIASWTGKYG